MKTFQSACLIVLGIGLSMIIAGLIWGADTSWGENLNLPVCATEDSDNCYWNASERGNGFGTDFVVIDGTYFYPED